MSLPFYDNMPGPERRDKFNQMWQLFQQAVEKAVGPQGWSPKLSLVSDGARKVFAINDWVGGEGTKPALTGYIGATGIVANIADAIDVAGTAGQDGKEVELSATATEIRWRYVGDVSWNSLVAISSLKGEDGKPIELQNNGSQVQWRYSGEPTWNDLISLSAISGDDGTNGWTPVPAGVVDGTRVVIQVTDWVGGTGAKPTIGLYVGPTGFVASIVDAVDVRGPVGADGDPGPSNVLSIGTVTGGATASATITGTSPSQVLNLVLPKGDPGTNGTDGLAATVAVGTVTTGAPGTSATVVNSGTSSAAVFDFTIPRGDTGAGGGGSGDVVGPASATNNGVALFDSTTGKIIKDGGVLGTAAFEAATSFATAAQGTKADTAVQPGSLATVATSGAYADLTGKPTLGTASALNVPATGNAAAGEVVKGNDTRLSDSRPPTGSAGGVLSGSYPNPGFAVDMATQSELDAVSDVANAKLGDAPSDGKTYGRKDAAWAEVVAGGYTTGDVVVTARTLSTPDYVLPGSVYLQASYSGLFNQVGLLGNGGAAKAKLANPAVLPIAAGVNCSWDGSGTYLAVAAYNPSYELVVYKRVGLTLTKLMSLATGTVYPESCAWDDSGTYLTVGIGVAPFIHIYKRDGDTLTKLPDPADLPPSAGKGISWGDGNNILVIGHFSSPFMTVYSRAGDVFTKLPNPAALASAATGASIDAAGKYIALSLLASPFIAWYERNGTTLTKRTNPTTLPTGQGNCCALDRSGTYLAIGHNEAPYVTVYERSGTTLSRLTGISTPVFSVYSAAWDSSSKYLALGVQSSPFIEIHKRTDQNFVRLTAPTALPAGTARGVSWAGDGGFLAVAHATTPFITAYSSFDFDAATQFRTPSVQPLQVPTLKTYIKT